VAQTQLNQIVALEKGVKARAHADFTAAHHQLQKTALLSGISRTYKPKDEEGEQLPPESTRVQVQAEDVLRDTAATQLRMTRGTSRKRRRVLGRIRNLCVRDSRSRPTALPAGTRPLLRSTAASPEDSGSQR